MIGVSSSSRSFAVLGRYLVVGRDNVEQGRVAWTAGRNLPTDDPQIAATIMRATASENSRVSQPVYHIALSFDPHDVVNRQTMERVADRVLSELKLHEHQAIIVAHSDRAHPHLHILVNRVHPETGRVWDRWQDYPAIQRALRDEERALGLRQVDGRTNSEQDRARSESPSVTAPSERTGKPVSYRSSDRRIEAIRADFDTHDRVNELAQKRYAGERELSATSARVERVDAAFDRLGRADNAFDEALGRAYRDPVAAKQKFLEVAGENGEKEAARLMREFPSLFGRAIVEESTGLLRGASNVHERVKSASREAAAFGAEVVASRREIANLVDSQRRDGRAVAAPGPREAAQVRETMINGVTVIRKKLETIRESEKALPTRTQLEVRLAEGLRRLSPPEFEKLRSVLSLHQLSLANRLRQIARDVALGRDDPA